MKSAAFRPQVDEVSQRLLEFSASLSMTVAKKV